MIITDSARHWEPRRVEYSLKWWREKKMKDRAYKKILNNMQIRRGEKVNVAGFDFCHRSIFVSSAGHSFNVSTYLVDSLNLYMQLAELIKFYTDYAIFESLPASVTDEADFSMTRFVWELKKVGVSFTFIDPKNTSSMCYRCNNFIGNPKFSGGETWGKFTCDNCGLTAHSDINASLNIAKAGGVKILDYHTGASLPSWGDDMVKNPPKLNGNHFGIPF